MEAHFGKPIKQYPGQQQVDRAVVVSGQALHLPERRQAEALVRRHGSGVPRAAHLRAARHGARRTPGPASASSARATALDDPDHRGFWTTLGLFNRWRHDACERRSEPDLLIFLYAWSFSHLPMADPRSGHAGTRKNLFISNTFLHCLRCHLRCLATDPHLLPPSLSVRAAGPHRHRRCGPQARTFQHLHLGWSQGVHTGTGSAGAGPALPVRVRAPSVVWVLVGCAPHAPRHRQYRKKERTNERCTHTVNEPARDPRARARAASFASVHRSHCRTSVT